LLAEQLRALGWAVEVGFRVSARRPWRACALPLPPCNTAWSYCCTYRCAYLGTRTAACSPSIARRPHCLAVWLHVQLHVLQLRGLLTWPASTETHPACCRRVVLQVPGRVYITQELPKGPTGKVQRRFMAAAFCSPSGGAAAGLQRSSTASHDARCGCAGGCAGRGACADGAAIRHADEARGGNCCGCAGGCACGCQGRAGGTAGAQLARAPTAGGGAAGPESGLKDGYAAAARALADAGVRYMFGACWRCGSWRLGFRFRMNRTPCQCCWGSWGAGSA
jgi:hypothetical protein